MKMRQMLCPRREHSYARVALTRDFVPALADRAAVTSGYQHWDGLLLFVR